MLQCLLEIYFILNYVYVYGCEYKWLGSQRSDPLELELQVVVSWRDDSAVECIFLQGPKLISSTHMAHNHL